MRAALALCALAVPLALAPPAAAAKADRPADAGGVARALFDLHAAADADGDGNASPEEIRSFLVRLPRAEALVADKLLAEADANRDGAVDAGEIAALERDFETFLTARLADEGEDDDQTEADPAAVPAGI